MAKVLLIMPRLPQKNGAPYIGQQYLAASLLRDGHEVRCVDLAAAKFTGTEKDVVDVAESWTPDMIGMTLFTQNAVNGYRLVKKMKGMTRLLVAGGPHATVLPDEALEHGFDVVVCGEGEEAVTKLARWLDNGTMRPFPEIDGCCVKDGGHVSVKPIEDLDSLPFPMKSYDCFDETAYSKNGVVVVGGMITSRGCPAQCTFCANYVTGRRHKWRSARNVVEEMKELRVVYHVNHFPIWDDAFTAKRPRVAALCDAILAEYALEGITWACNTPANMMSPGILPLMKKAGCVAINFGIESGDRKVLKAIKKGQDPDHIRKAVTAAKAEGMTTIVNFMFGFPGEDVRELESTLELMWDLSPDTDVFNHRGVLIPFPGTAIYDENHEKYDFTRWWLDPAYIPEEPDWFEMDPKQSQEYLEHDPVLDFDFFHYSDAVRDKIKECVLFKARHTQRMMGMA